jgi:gas vesicle protein
MAENETGSSGLGWFLAGLGIGALVGVLYAPKSGRETREDLANSAADAQRRAAELIDQGRQRANEYAEQGRQMMEQGRQKANDLVEQGRQQAQQYTDKGREYYEKGRSQWSQYVEKGKSMVNEQQAKAGAAVDAAKDAYEGGSPERSTGTAG